MSSSLSRPFNLSLEGRHGELVKVTIRPDIHMNSNGDSDDFDPNGWNNEEWSARVMPPENATVILVMQLRINRKPEAASEVAKSAFMCGMQAFVTEYGARFRVRDRLEIESENANDKTRLEAHLQLDNFPSPLRQKIASKLSLSRITVTFNMYETYTDCAHPEPDLRDQLRAGTANSSLQSLIHRIAIKLFGGLATRYPLVFDGRWLETLELHANHFASIGRSLSRLTQKSDYIKSTLSKACEARLSKLERAPGQVVNPTKIDTTHADNIRMKVRPKQSTQLQPVSSAVEMALMRLLLRRKPKRHSLLEVATVEMSRVRDSSSSTTLLSGPAHEGIHALQTSKCHLTVNETTALPFSGLTSALQALEHMQYDEPIGALDTMNNNTEYIAYESQFASGLLKSSLDVDPLLLHLAERRETENEPLPARLSQAQYHEHLGDSRYLAHQYLEPLQQRDIAGCRDQQEYESWDNTLLDELDAMMEEQLEMVEIDEIEERMRFLLASNALPNIVGGNVKRWRLPARTPAF